MTLSEEIKKEPYFKSSNLSDLEDCEYAINEWRRLNRKYDYPINKQFALIIDRISRKKIELENKQQKISGTMAKFKKGSKEAKEFMAKLRASKKGAKKKAAPKKKVKVFKTRKLAIKHVNKLRKKKALPLINGEKHTDIKSHNYRITIGELKEETLKEYYDILERLKNGQLYIDAFKHDIKRYGRGKGSGHEARMENMRYTRKWMGEKRKRLAILKKLIKSTL